MPLSNEQLTMLTDAANALLASLYAELEVSSAIPHISRGMTRAVMDAAAALGLEGGPLDPAPVGAVTPSMPAPRRVRRVHPPAPLTIEEVRALAYAEIRRIAGLQPAGDWVSQALFDEQRTPGLPNAGAIRHRLLTTWKVIVKAALGEDAGRPHYGQRNPATEAADVTNAIANAAPEDETAPSVNGFRAESKPRAAMD